MSPMQTRKRSLRDRVEDPELSLTLSWGDQEGPAKIQRKRTKLADGIFQCKTCGRRFPTFQALGGHRTSHMRTKAGRSTCARSGEHRCTVCGARFALGQALGGHMRRHKAMGEELKKLPGFCMAPLEVNLYEVVRRSSSHCKLLELFV